MVKHLYRLGTVAVLLALSACEVTIGSDPQTPPAEDVATQDPPGNTATRSGASDEGVATTGTGGGIATSRPTAPQPPVQPQSPPQPIAQTSTSFETRCGWFSNPTPGNISLYDADREWIIGVQGGHQVATDWDWPNFAPDQWVVTNVGSYGYGCACMDVRTNPATGTINDIRNVRAQAIAICQQDPALNRWANLFP
ncbi:DUF4087 domain-containing protein [Picosynechococcus sp. PCC 7003]|uniref:DUF4087 domain-containing protein n=1 Tax=Picosynechococcus sp. PCC 7003 TaxID=374981 RepID=UPI0009FE9C12|nr:DUF4087 domain-containing protein [Picosynechococcus sp. PCC 7003]